jgi:hypothetical protein
MELPRVTEILKPFVTFGKVSSEILQNAAIRGTKVHALCAGIANGAWVPDSAIAEEYKGYVDSFLSWMQAQVQSFLIIEKRYIDEHLGYTGQVDFVIVANDGLKYLVDIKTSAKPQKTYPLQMAAYESLLSKNEVQVDGAMLVYLDKQGEFPNIEVIEDFTYLRHIFYSALDCWNYFHRRKKDGIVA